MKGRKGFGEFLRILGITPPVIFLAVVGIISTGAIIGLGVRTVDKRTKPVPRPVSRALKTQDVKREAEAAQKPEDTAKVSPLVPFEEYSVYAGPVDPPLIAVIIDDMGVDMIRTQRVLRLGIPLTLSYLTYAPQLQDQIDQARDLGFEVMLHVPMEARSSSADYGGRYLSLAQSSGDNVRVLGSFLDKARGYIGINNHMGSAFTVDSGRMEALIEELGRRGLAFVDSKTTPKSRHRLVAERHGVPFAERDVFIDDSSAPGEIRARLDDIERIARKRGFVVAIGHPRDNTISALSEWARGLKEKGMTIVPVSNILQRMHR
ncbi:MAG: divergent polysaccharide deacetylase family protein [Rickettsiales bacterium]|jgi:polysaccharide deacetylase 2 family uncharacterized protein YibQ|nr:divergent polysaccharide deacetylase family protein [Rickettsiales bacterium]